jgi:esterase/lipase
MNTLRTRFKKDIVAEFLSPARKTKKDKVIILCDGMPSVPSKKHLLEFFSKKGFWVFHPRYRGSWESDGKFLAQSPHLDILDVINGLYQGIAGTTDFDYNYIPTFKNHPDEVYIVTSSFGGPAALLASRDKRVTKVFVFSPVIDWTKPGKDEPLESLAAYTKHAFGNGYRTAKDGWKKLASGTFYNPVNHIDGIDGTKVFIIHSKDDTITPYSETKKFAVQTKSTLITLSRGGHLGTSLLLKPRFYNLFKKFIKK